MSASKPHISHAGAPESTHEWLDGCRDGSLSACETILSDVVERYAKYAEMGDRVAECRTFVGRLVYDYDRRLAAERKNRVGL